MCLYNTLAEQILPQNDSIEKKHVKYVPLKMIPRAIWKCFNPNLVFLLILDSRNMTGTEITRILYSTPYENYYILIQTPIVTHMVASEVFELFV